MFDTKYRASLMMTKSLYDRISKMEKLVNEDIPLMTNKTDLQHVTFGSQGVKLLDYQVKGVRWIMDAWDNNRNVILADEMGLGKTIQAIAFIRQVMFIQKITRPFLVAVPLSVIENWRREFDKWLPEANVLIFSGSKDARKKIENLEFFMSLKSNGQDLHVPKFNVLLTSYDALRTDFMVFVPFEWQALIIDEGQRMKNNNSKLFQMLSQLCVQFRLLLSGTPL